MTGRRKEPNFSKREHKAGEDEMFLDPALILKKLDERVFGQERAKKDLTKVVFLNLTRLFLTEEQRKIFKKKNVLLVGPTGSGKTELARVLVEILGIPFCRVSATDFTLTGYKGSDPEEIITVHLYGEVLANLDRYWENFSKLLALRETYYMLLESSNKQISEYMIRNNIKILNLAEFVIEDTERKEKDSYKEQEKKEEQIFLDDSWEEIIFTSEDIKELKREFEKITEELSELDISSNLTEDTFRKIVREQYKKELKKLNRLRKDEKIKYLMEYAVIFIDEFDKLFLKGYSIEDFYGNLQKQLLTLIEGKIIRKGSESSKVGYHLGKPVSTENMTFIAAGTFADVNSDDLIGELKGRFPVITTVERLSFESYLRILEKKFEHNSIFKDLRSKWSVKITMSAIRELAMACQKLNEIEYLGARRVEQLEYLVMNYISDKLLLEGREKVIVNAKVVRKLLKSHLSFDILDREKEKESYPRLGFV